MIPKIETYDIVVSWFVFCIKQTETRPCNSGMNLKVLRKNNLNRQNTDIKQA